MSFLQTSDNFWSNRIKLKKKLNGLSYRTYIKYAGRGKWRGGGGGGGRGVGGGLGGVGAGGGGGGLGAGWGGGAGGGGGVLQIFQKRIRNPGDHGPKSQQFFQEIFHGPSHQF